MRLNDETTIYQLHHLLTEKGYLIFLRIILCCRMVWARRSMALPIASSSEKLTRPRGLPGQNSTHRTVLKMWYGWTSAQYRWRVIAILCVENMERHHVPSQGVIHVCTVSITFTASYSCQHKAISITNYERQYRSFVDCYISLGYMHAYGVVFVLIQCHVYVLVTVIR